MHTPFGVFGVQTFNHQTLNHDRVKGVRDKTHNHVRVRMIDSSPLAMSSYKVYVIECLVIKCRVMKCR